MRPLKLNLTNFLSYRGEHAIEFDGVTLAVLSGQNGAGKSSLIDAMRFALFGHARGGLDSVISEGEETCRVEFTFALGEDLYLISRQRSRKGAGSTALSFQYRDAASDDSSWQVLDGKTVPETQRRIEDTLHLTDDLFTATACANQGNAAAFSQARPAERKQVLGEILDLGTWERRAEVARQMSRDLAARTQAERARHEALCAAAAEADGLREQIARNDAAQGDVVGQIETADTELAEAQEAKESLARDKEADRARRRELEEFTERWTRADQAAQAASARLESLHDAVEDKPALLKRIRAAEEAGTYAQELEARRQEAERLDGELRLLRQQIEAEERAHHARGRELEQTIKHARMQREHEIDALLERYEALTRQVAVLGEVPCANPVDEATRAPFLAIRDKCPLIAQAREAEHRLPELEQQIERLQAETPWADAERELDAHVQAEPAAEHKARLAKLTAERDEAAYDAKEHAEAKRRAGKLPDLQADLQRIERAEAQMAEVQSNFKAAQAEAKELAERNAALEKELGPARNWDAMLAQVERAISAARQKLRALQQEAQSLQTQRGGLEERLRAAEDAGKQAEELKAALRENDRRLKLLKILAQAFGKAGIPALLIEKAVPDLEAVANDVLSALSDGAMSLELRSQRETKAKTLQETLDIIIADERGTRPYESFSGGEAMRVDLAVRIALSVLLASRAGARCELLVLDETCAPLDAHGRALFVDCLQRVAERFATILVVTHVDDLKDLFPYRFDVTKGPDGSRVEVVAA